MWPRRRRRRAMRDCGRAEERVCRTVLFRRVLCVADERGCSGCPTPDARVRARARERCRRYTGQLRVRARKRWNKRIYRKTSRSREDTKCSGPDARRPRTIHTYTHGLASPHVSEERPSASRDPTVPHPERYGRLSLLHPLLLATQDGRRRGRAHVILDGLACGTTSSPSTSS